MPSHRHLPPPVLVDTPRKLESCLADLLTHEEVAIDTEADSLHSYREKLCLIQATAGSTDYLIDPLVEVDPRSLRRVLEAPRPLKVLHDAEFDVSILQRDFGLSIRGLFDTRVAASALGYSRVGLASLLEERFGVELDKRLQRSDWSARPLSRDQMEYARLDTHFLVPLMHQLRDELRQRGRLHIVETEHRRLERLKPAPVGFDPEGFARLKGASSLDPAQATALRELYLAREELARARDAPPFRVLSPAALITLARRRPASRRQLEGIRGLPRRLAPEVVDAILRAVERARRRPPIERLPSPRQRRHGATLDRAQRKRLERMRTWRKERAQRLRLDPSLLLHRQAMLRLAKRPPASLEELADRAELAPWQLEELGADLLRLLAGDERQG